jgi:DNA-binding transcriptional LysR family regulator
MNSGDWIILQAIGEEGSITKAAERLFIAQPSLTYRLNRLEKEFGTKILLRYSTGVVFTPQGEFLLQYSNEMIHKLNQVKQAVIDMDNEISGILRLGVSTTFAKYNIAPIMKLFMERYPNAKVDLFTGASTLELSELKIGETVDIIIRRGDVDWPEGKNVIMEESYGIFTSCRMDLMQLADLPWILDESATITKSDKEFLEWWAETLKTPPPSKIIHVNSIETCVQLASHGLGWTVLPKIHATNKRSLCFTPIIWPDGHMMTQKTVMLYKDEVLKSRLAKVFVDFILHEFVPKHLL